MSSLNLDNIQIGNNPTSSQNFIISQAADFYVYGHYKKDTGEIFYIGKGRCKRAYSKSRRNKFWNSVVVKHDFYVKILFDNLTEEEALNTEIDQIALYGTRLNSNGSLVNLTIGGEGTSGYAFTEDQKIKVSEIMKAKWANEDYRRSQVTAQGGNPNVEKRQKNKLNSPEHKKYMSERSTKQMSNPEFKAKFMAARDANKRTHESYAAQAALRKGVKRDPEIMKKVAAKNTGQKRTAEQKKRMSDAKKALWVNPEFRSRMLINMHGRDF